MTIPTFSSRRAFTLIELLVVIAIIAILATLLFPAVGNALYQAKKTQAKNDAAQIASAIGAYQVEYGRLPITGGDDLVTQDEDGAIMDALCPNPGTTSTLNPRQITFLEVPKAKNKANGRDKNTGAYLDPWGQGYWISLDGNYDGTVKGPSGTSESEDIRKTVIVWSKADPKRPADYDHPEKWVKSWE